MTNPCNIIIPEGTTGKIEKVVQCKLIMDGSVE